MYFIPWQLVLRKFRSTGRWKRDSSIYISWGEIDQFWMHSLRSINCCLYTKM